MDNFGADEFGDASFLDDFDVENAIQNSLKKKPKTKDSSKSNKPEEFDVNLIIQEESPSNKRLKVDPSLSNTLQTTLQQYFGYSQFRPGQEQVMDAILSKQQDVAIFWATGAGKSLCYQLLPLHLNQVAIVVSPLISLMQDQVAQLNARSQNKLAVFLGSAQTDHTLQDRALQGHFPLIYVTPEKMNTNFPAQLVTSGLAKRICLIAVDEAHCVSEWGHDFRPDYRTLGDILRNQHPALQHIPILSLTATATNRVQNDIVTSLRLRSPLISQRSVDRTNLRITIQTKTKDVAGTFRPWFQKWNDADKVPSTIVYAATRSQVDSIATLLQQNLKPHIAVAAYHAGLTPPQRQTAHMQFLTGQVPIIVATVAFGMGIDKPDIREIVHYGPPKTVEEYAQQMGRAGRDGLTANCTLIYSPADFDKYLGEFYLGQLTDTAKQVMIESIQTFKAMCQDHQSCRRKVLVQYFQQTPAFGDWCGTCDVCLARDKYQGDQERDFGVPARIVLTAVMALNRQGLTNILKVATGNVVEPYRYDKFAWTPAAVQQQIEVLKGDEKKYTSKYLKELVPGLVRAGYITESMESKKLSGYDRTWTVYDITARGRDALQNTNTPILLPVPESVREQEKLEEERRQRVLQELSNRGLKKEKIPEEELKAGDGDVVRAYSKWYSYIETIRRSSEQRASDLERVLTLIDEWRSATAVKLRIAPVSVLAEHLMVSLAYSVATLPPQMGLNKDIVMAAGVRTNTVDELVESLMRWLERTKPMQLANTDNVANARDMELGMMKGVSWEFALYKPQKKTGKATWENSYDRFQAGENPLAIAMVPGGTKQPIQVQTVVGHILEATVFGREVDLQRLAEFTKPPNEKEWEELRAAELATGMNVCGDPETSGKNGDKFTMTEFLKPITGDNIDRALFSQWCNHLKWYMALRRAGYEPKFVDRVAQE